MGRNDQAFLALMGRLVALRFVQARLLESALEWRRVSECKYSDRLQSIELLVETTSKEQPLRSALPRAVCSTGWADQGQSPSKEEV